MIVSRPGGTDSGRVFWHLQRRGLSHYNEGPEREDRDRREVSKDAEGIERKDSRKRSIRSGIVSSEGSL